MRFTDSISIEATDYKADMPTSEHTGFQDDVHHILGAYLRKSSERTSSFHVKSSAWLDRVHGDRSRTGASAARPFYGARFNTEFHWNSPSNDDYTLYLRTSHLPAVSLFVDGTDSTVNPIPCLDAALIAYGTAAILENTGAIKEADRQLQRAYGLIGVSIGSDERHPAVEQIADMRGMSPLGGRTGYLFSLSDLQDVYPES